METKGLLELEWPMKTKTREYKTAKRQLQGLKAGHDDDNLFQHTISTTKKPRSSEPNSSALLST